MLLNLRILALWIRHSQWMASAFVARMAFKPALEECAYPAVVSMSLFLRGYRLVIIPGTSLSFPFL